MEEGYPPARARKLSADAAVHQDLRHVRDGHVRPRRQVGDARLAPPRRGADGNVVQEDLVLARRPLRQLLPQRLLLLGLRFLLSLEILLGPVHLGLELLQPALLIPQGLFSLFSLLPSLLRLQLHLLELVLFGLVLLEGLGVCRVPLRPPPLPVLLRLRTPPKRRRRLWRVLGRLLPLCLCPRCLSGLLLLVEPLAEDKVHEAGGRCRRRCSVGRADPRGGAPLERLAVRPGEAVVLAMLHGLDPVAVAAAVLVPARHVADELPEPVGTGLGLPGHADVEGLALGRQLLGDPVAQVRHSRLCRPLRRQACARLHQQGAQTLLAAQGLLVCSVPHLLCQHVQRLLLRRLREKPPLLVLGQGVLDPRLHQIGDLRGQLVGPALHVRVHALRTCCIASFALSLLFLRRLHFALSLEFLHLLPHFLLLRLL
mmetsp:Transcript_8873/g.24072  ORF Transcript_8873/g.24072 Transcript_8873/m.24072 type:complete len:427 (-) Transcript_8873:290-1570(-)